MTRGISDDANAEYLTDILDDFEDEPPAPKTDTERLKINEREFRELLESNMSNAFNEKFNGITEIEAPKKQEFRDLAGSFVAKMQDSQAEAKIEIESSINADPMEQMMKDLEGLMENGDFESMLGGMMKDLVTKELLHEPMKDLADKYPDWIEANRSTLEISEVVRFESQNLVIVQMVAIFEACTDKELSSGDSILVTDLMQQMQALGSPPEALMKDFVPITDSQEGATDDSLPSECKNM